MVAFESKWLEKVIVRAGIVPQLNKWLSDKDENPALINNIPAIHAKGAFEFYVGEEHSH